MNASDRQQLRWELREAAARTAACLPIERIDEALTPAEQAHVESCARCQTELTLWRELDAAAAAGDDGAAVRWIAAEVARRRSEPVGARRRSWWGAFSAPGLVTAVAAMLVVALGLGYLLRDRAPAIHDSGGDPIYRSMQLEVVSPVGDVAAAPPTLTWRAVAGAVRYDVAILEVDRSVIWSGFSSEPRVVLPSSVVSRFVKGKPFSWEVTARDAGGAVLAISGSQRFRVTGP